MFHEFRWDNGVEGPLVVSSQKIWQEIFFFTRKPLIYPTWLCILRYYNNFTRRNDFSVFSKILFEQLRYAEKWRKNSSALFILWNVVQIIIFLWNTFVTRIPQFKDELIRYQSIMVTSSKKMTLSLLRNVFLIFNYRNRCSFRQY